MNIDNFLLLSGEDIPLISSNIIIHNPTIKELVQVFLYENSFLTGFEFLFFSKDMLQKREQEVLANLSDYEVLVALLNAQSNVAMKEQLDCFKNFLSLLFQSYNIEYKEENIVLTKDEYICIIDEKLFNEIKVIVKKMFPFKTREGSFDYNPQNERARQIAEKLKKSRKKLEKQRKAKQLMESLFEKYISILTIGLQIPVNELYQCTVFQLFNMFERFEKKVTYDVHLKAQLAGATGMKEVDHWMV